MRPLEKANIYLVSDSSGETVMHMANAALAQFQDIHISKFTWPMIRSKEQIDHLMTIMEVKPGIILYTLVDTEIEAYLKELCDKNAIYIVSVLGQLIDELGNFLHSERLHGKPGIQHKIFGEEYQKRIAAIDFTLAHDDGQRSNDLKDADVLIIGVSRTSKSPTSMYLSQRGYRTANIPFINRVKIDINFSKLTTCLVIGLTISAEKLKSIRENRLASLTDKAEYVNNYTNITEIKNEILEARKFFAANNIPVIDVSNKAIEETAAEIINLYQSKLGILEKKVYNDISKDNKFNA